MNTTAITGVITAVLAVASIASAVAIAWKREMFEQERVRRADMERMERNRKWIDQMDEVHCHGNIVPCMPFMSGGYNGMQNMMMGFMGRGRQIDVNWSDDGFSPMMSRLMNNYNNRVDNYSRPMSTYGYGYGYGYNSPNNQTNNYQTYNNTEFTFDNNDSVIRMIASRPPTASPLFGNRLIA